MMKIVIDIPDCVWERLKNKDCDMGDGNTLLCSAWDNGMPLEVALSVIRDKEQDNEDTN